jgi:hypothetical protein
VVGRDPCPEEESHAWFTILSPFQKFVISIPVLFLISKDMIKILENY